jgi:hypothetical protein
MPYFTGVFMKMPTMYCDFTMDTIVVIQDQATRESYENEPYSMGTALYVPCVCGASLHPIVGAWCTRCGAKVVQIREVR